MPAVTAWKMKHDGMTTRQIAQTLGRKPEQIKTLVQLGARLMSIAPEER
jgi:DNA-binding CsgD family transcriptional regulator